MTDTIIKKLNKKRSLSEMETVEKFSFSDLVIPQKFYNRIYKDNKEITEIYKERLNKKQGLFYGDYKGAGIFIEFYFKPEKTNRILCLSPEPTFINGTFCLTKELETIDYENVERIDMYLNGNDEQITCAQEKLDEILEETLNDYCSYNWRRK